MAWGVFLISRVARRVAYLGTRRLLRDQPTPRRPRTQGLSREREAPPAGAEPADWFEAKSCPVCGARHPSGTPYCSKDATPLKEMP
jgi:hypothetical protein